MLDVGEQKKRRKGIDGRMTFVEADAQQLPFAMDTFQIVCVAFGLRNVAGYGPRVAGDDTRLPAGGRVAVLEFSLPERQPIKSLYGWYFRNVLPRIGQWLARNDHEAYDYLPQSVGEFPQGKAVDGTDGASRIASGRYHPLSFGVATLYVGVKVMLVPVRKDGNWRSSEVGT